MKAPSLPVPILLLFLTITGCESSKSPERYLQKVLTNLEKIETAVYEETRQSWNPGDPTPVYTECRLIKEYNNPADSTIGASFVSLHCADTTLLDFAYNGEIRVDTYHENKGLVIDDFTARPLPYRPLFPPFFNYTESIIRYILTTNDSIQIQTEDSGKEYYIKLTIHEDRQIEFFGKDYRMEDNSRYYDYATSIYELWFNKSKNLPYKVRREMAHSISAVTCTEAEFNTLSIDDFNIYDYFPQDYEIRKYGIRNNKQAQSELTGKKAPDWTLNDMYEQPVALKDLKSKAVLVNFTGIGCGPCILSIPFLNQLKSEFNTDDLEVVSIETWIRKPHALLNYAEKHKISYKFLCAVNPVIEQYKTGRAAPYFFILDKDRMIRNVYFGYTPDKTDKDIRDAINKLL